MLQDLRFAFRLLAKERWYTAVAVTALALGIGVNTTGFVIVNGAFLRGLPYDNADRLYVLSGQTRGGRTGASFPDYQDWRAQSRTFAAIGAFRNENMNVSDDRALPEQVAGTWITTNVFRQLGQTMQLGRDFLPTDDQQDAERVVIIGFRVWQNRYGGAPSVIGKSIRVNGHAATIVGVMPRGVAFPHNNELWMPLTATAADASRRARTLNVLGFLRDDVTRAEAQAEMNGIAQRLAAAYPDTNKDVIGVRMATFTEEYVGGRARVMFLALMGAVGFVLLIACANVANLLLARSAHRAREIAVRVASGATRWRVLRQLLVESVVLGCIGGIIGFGIAQTAVPMLDAIIQADPGKPYWIAFTVDYVVLAYVAGLCVFTGILFGLAPALHVSKANITDVLKEGGRGTLGNRRMQWLSGSMVVVELALTIVLLVGAGLMLRTFVNLAYVDVGIDTQQLIAMRLRLSSGNYPTAEARRAFFDRLEPQLASIAGLADVSLTTSVPPFDAEEREILIDGRIDLAPNDRTRDVGVVMVSPTFFNVVQARPRRGRLFDDRDGAPGFENVVINEQFARRFFAGEDPLGKRVRFHHKESWRTVVGVTPTIKHGSPRDIEPEAIVYAPLRQNPPVSASLLMRSDLAPTAVMDSVRRAVQAIDADQPVFSAQTVDQMLEQDRWPFRVFGGLFVVFAVIALVLSAVGLYAVMAYSVTQRRAEIGVRMALGAEGRQVSWLILKRGLMQLAIGLALGLAGAFAIGGVLQRLLVGVSARDPLTFAAITSLLTVVAITACVLPARRATRVDPVIALRAD